MANPDHVGPFVKPDAIERRIAKHAKRVEKGRIKRALDAVAWAAWDALKRLVYERDHGCCRVCGKALKFRSDNPLEESDAHHIIFRSAGGVNETWNLITVCAWPCHKQIHRRVPSSWLEVEGNGDVEVSIREINPETGRTIRQWESVAPVRSAS